MNTERLRLLQQFVREEPNDPFNHYALALETAKVDPVRALELFKNLITATPEYIPSYYQTALLLSELLQPELASTILKQGIQQAKIQNELKAMNEMNSLLNELIDE